MTTLRRFKRIAIRADAHLVQDAIGLAALTVMLVVGLHVPHVI